MGTRIHKVANNTARISLLIPEEQINLNSAHGKQGIRR